MATKARQKIIQTAFTDYDPKYAALNLSEFDYSKILNIPDQLGDFRYIAPDWSLFDLCMLWLIFSSQAFQFSHFSKTGVRSKTHYTNFSGSNAVILMIKDCLPLLTHKANQEKLELLFKTLPIHEKRAELIGEIISAKESVLQIVYKIISSAKSGVVSCELAEELAERLPLSFADPYLKKAQLAVSAIAGCVCHSLEIEVHDELTAFADYEVPRVLNHLGAIKYSEELQRGIRAGTEILEGSTAEKAIRAATILAVEGIAVKTEKRASVIDNYLWNKQRTIAESAGHFTITTNY